MFAILLSAALLLGLLGACDRQGVSTPTQPADAPAQPTASGEGEGGLSAQALVEAVFPYSGCEASEVEHLNADADREYLAAYIENAYGLPEGQWEDAAVVRATGASAFELAVLRLEDGDAAVRAASGLMSYIFSRQGDFAGYAPAEADMAANGGIMQDGCYAALFICPDPDGAQAALEAALNGTLTPPQAVSTPEPTRDVVELLNRLLEIYALYEDDAPGLERTDSSDPDRLKSIVEGEYGLADYPWTDAAIARGKNDNVFEMAVLHIDGDEHMGMDAVLELNAYLDGKEAAYAGSPAQAELLHSAMAAWNNGFIALLVCNGPENIALNLGGSLGYTTGRGSGYSTMRRYREELPVPSVEPDSDHPDRVKFTQPGKDDMSLYDTSAIRAAWASGDPSGLSQYDRETYDAAKAILGEILADGMTDMEKETAIYYWLVNHVDYDWRHQDIMAKTPRSSYEPHGGLVDCTAVCLGYATSFQLLMDLAGVECITVVGAAFRSEEDHAWNMVRLNGEWYCVDVTWDANGREQLGPGEPEDWDYFNVTSDWMAKRNHQWDYANTPEATAEDHGQG